MDKESEKYRGKFSPVPEWTGDMRGGFGWFTNGKRDLWSTNQVDRTTLLKTQGKVNVEVLLKGIEIIQATPLPEPSLKERVIKLIRRSG
ncbi:MAG: hypothetical protein A2857_02330 [Candidatus Levybacteria bacterium RIFCSPHIGHO2_01_FULL_36_15]|nr:MAG: hypothetical protein A2857_02330 [Candidatus Levybacteria bacterium RIFCSPHIGHO2_01_FULL_36_15]